MLTASNIDIITGKLTLEPKLLYLRDDYMVNNVYKVKKFDIVMSNASGSLKHLGKVALADRDYEQVIGSFISIIRCRNQDLSVALYFRLLSKEFRELMLTKKQQNINNFSTSDFTAITLRLPEDLSSFAQKAKSLTLIAMQIKSNPQKIPKNHVL